MAVIRTSLRDASPTKPRTFRIVEPQLLLVEGNDDQCVFERLAHERRVPSLQIIDMNGKSDWGAKLQAICSAPEFASVSALGLVRDADQSPAGAVKSLRGALSKSGLPVPASELGPAEGDALRTIYLVLPGLDTPGKLETLVLQSLPEQETKCLDKYFECMDAVRPVDKRDDEKARVQGWLATLDGPCRNIAMAVAEDRLPLSSPAFDRCRALIDHFV